MRLLDELEAFTPSPGQGLFLGLGNFDGIHLGHRALIRRVRDLAQKNSGIAAVLTFQNHPQQILHPERKPRLLISPRHKLLFFQESGLALCFWLPFTLEFSKIRARDFVERILVRKLQVRGLCMGHNASFGHGREGSAVFMRQMAAEAGFSFEEIEPVQVHGTDVSSSRLRHLIGEGKLEEAAECLGRPFSVLGKVAPGEQRGRGLGFPTANLNLESHILPPHGVYPARVREVRSQTTASGPHEFSWSSHCEEWQPGILNYGLRPTFRNGAASPEALLEVHLLEGGGDLYGTSLEVMIYPRLRAEMKFENAESLKEQIQRDVIQARRFFDSPASNKSFTSLGD